MWQFDYYHIFVIMWEYSHDSVMVSDSDVYTMIFYYRERLSQCKRGFKSHLHYDTDSVAVLYSTITIV